MDMILKKNAIRRQSTQNRAKENSDIRRYHSRKTVDTKIVKSLRKKINIASKVMGEELKSWI